MPAELFELLEAVEKEHKQFNVLLLPYVSLRLNSSLSVTDGVFYSASRPTIGSASASAPTFVAAGGLSGQQSSPGQGASNLSAQVAPADSSLAPIQALSTISSFANGSGTNGSPATPGPAFRPGSLPTPLPMTNLPIPALAPRPGLGDDPVIPLGGFPTHDEAEKAFVHLLKKAAIDATWTWDRTMRAIITDPLYKALGTLAEKKACWEKVRIIQLSASLRPLLRCDLSFSMCPQLKRKRRRSRKLA